MPLIVIHAPEGAFDVKSRDALADEVTTLGLKCERLPNTPFVRSTTWIYVNEYKPTHVYSGGKVAKSKVVSVEVNVFEGGLDAEAKEQIMAGVTELIGKYSGAEKGSRLPVYVVVRDVPAINWGVFGAPGSLSALRNPPADAAPV